MWRRATRKAGVADYRFHDLRHLAVTLAAVSVATTRELMHRIGHSSVRAALIYQHATADRDRVIAEAMRRVIEPEALPQGVAAKEASEWALPTTRTVAIRRSEASGDAALYRHLRTASSGWPACQFGLTTAVCQSKLTTVEIDDLGVALSSDDPAVGLRASSALHRLAERIEAKHVATAREAGWSWQQIGDALGLTRQSVHTKYSKELS